MKDDNQPFFRMGRRMFLRGAGGTVLALPFLPSLLTATEAKAATPLPKCFAHFRSPHGGNLAANMYPPDSLLVDQMTYIHTIRHGALAAPVNASGYAVISPSLSAPSSVLTPSLLSKLNVLRGLDITTDLGHNFSACCGYFGPDFQTSPNPRPTIDQLIAYSPQVYPVGSTSFKRRSVVIASRFANTQMMGFATPGVRSSGVSTDSIQGIDSSWDLYNSLLAGTSSTTTTTTRPPVVDRVLDSYNRLRNGSKRLSAADKLRLDQHISAVAALQHNLSTAVGAGCVVPAKAATDSQTLCGDYNAPPMDGHPDMNKQFWQLINAVIAVAMNCGTCRVANYTMSENFLGCTFTSRPSLGEDWHLNVVHNAETQNANTDLVKQFHQGFFEDVFLDLASRLNSFSDGMGGTLLDSSLLAWGTENGEEVHEMISMPVITAGSAGGALQTGSYCDYRNLSLPTTRDTNPTVLHTGLIYNQWLTTALVAMGSPQSDWSETTHPGFGARMQYKSGDFNNVYTDAMWQKTGEKLPWL
jgi:hypothetical protein